MQFLKVCLFLYLFALHGESLNAGLIKTPSGLRLSVEFWESIFEKYSHKQCVFHDSKYVNVIFQVKKISSGRKSKYLISRSKSNIRKALGKFSRGSRPKNRFEKRIYAAVPKNLRSKNYWRRAQKRIRCQRGIKESFKLSLARSSRHLPFIKRELRKKHIPVDLAYLPHLESGFNHRAHSKAGARGLWQLMPGTARGYMNVSRYRDDRLNTNISTKFAVRILKNNYKKTNSWPLAITGYNYGINGVVKAIKKYRTNDYMVIRNRHKTRIFGFAAKNFFPSFLAVRNLALKQKLLSKKKKKVKMF